MTLGEYIKQYRQMHGISQREFAKISGLSNTYVSYLERGYSGHGQIIAPSIETYQAIARATNCTAQDLLDYLDDEKEESPQPPLVNDDPELTEILQRIKDDPNTRMMFSLTKNATPEDVEKAVKIIQTLMGK